MSRDTLAVHGGEPDTHPHDALTAPIVQTATYTFESTAELRDFFEGRKDREEYDTIAHGPGVTENAIRGEHGLTARHGHDGGRLWEDPRPWHRRLRDWWRGAPG